MKFAPGDRRVAVTAATIAACPMADGGLGVSVSFPQPASPTASEEHHSPSDRHNSRSSWRHHDSPLHAVKKGPDTRCVSGHAAVQGG